MPPFRLPTHGDVVERSAWQDFLRDEFPEYETFWQVFVVGLTERVKDGYGIGFRPQVELDADGRPEWHVAVAQLHYTTLLHLVRVFGLRQEPIRDRDALIEAIARLSAATDTAFELLGRCRALGKQYAPWSETAGGKARAAWQKRGRGKHMSPGPLAPVRGYRNTLLHGRARAHYKAHDGTILCPSFEQMADAADWRNAEQSETVRANDLVDRGWAQVLSYLSRTWRAELVPWAMGKFVRPEIPPLSPRVMPYPPYLGAGSVSPSIPNLTQPGPTPGSATFMPPHGNG
jgi:hypothetical protein